MPSSHTPSDSYSKATDPASLPSHAVYHSPFYYQFAISLLKPLYRLQVWRRSHKRANYQQEVAQRFGKSYPPCPTLDSHYAKDVERAVVKSAATLDGNAKTNKGIIWCHAVSLGETNTVAPLLDALLAKGYQIWLTNTTQTGFARGASRFADDIAQGQMSHSYVPVDSPAVIERFLEHVQPVAAMFVETELWANILTKLSAHRIPSILVNGRLSGSSFKSYQKIGAVSASMMKNLSLIIAQDNESAKRFRQLGADSAKIRVAGSLKWVINTPKLIDKEAVIENNNDSQSAAKQKHNNGMAKNLRIEDRPIWVAASTHGGEEEVMLSWQQQLLSNPTLADTLLIIVPRHPERFDEVAELIQKTGLVMERRSAQEHVNTSATNVNTTSDSAINNNTIDTHFIHPTTQVYLADSMGELMIWYELADVALVGGSLVDVGGHNPVEPASVATPVLMGTHTQSCQSVVDKLASVGALYQPNNTSYRAIDINEQSAQLPQKDNQSVDDNNLLYQQLRFWLSHLSTTKQAGQAGAQMTQQQQAVLSRQLSMIEGVIEQSSQQAMS